MIHPDFWMNLEPYKYVLECISLSHEKLPYMSAFHVRNTAILHQTEDTIITPPQTGLHTTTNFQEPRLQWRT